MFYSFLSTLNAVNIVDLNVLVLFYQHRVQFLCRPYKCRPKQLHPFVESVLQWAKENGKVHFNEVTNNIQCQLLAPQSNLDVSKVLRLDELFVSII